MKNTSPEQLKLWVETWKRAGAALKEVERAELRAFDPKKHQDILDGMLQWACDHRQPRTGSGLVEQQRLFMKMRQRDMT